MCVLKKMKTKDEVLIYSFIIVILNGIILSLYHYVWDPNKDAERYYFKNCKIRYSLFKMSYLTLLFSFMFCVRYILYEMVFVKVKTKLQK